MGIPDERVIVNRDRPALSVGISLIHVHDAVLTQANIGPIFSSMGEIFWSGQGNMDLRLSKVAHPSLLTCIPRNHLSRKFGPFSFRLSQGPVGKSARWRIGSPEFDLAALRDLS